LSPILLRYPFNRLARPLFEPLFNTSVSREKALVKVWESIGMISALLHLLALTRILATLILYDQPFSFALDLVNRPPLDWSGMIKHELSGHSMRDLGRRVLILDWFSASLALMLYIFAVASAKTTKSRAMTLVRSIVLGPGSVFALVQRDLVTNVTKVE